MNNPTDLLPPNPPPWGLKKEYMRKREKERSRGGVSKKAEKFKKKKNSYRKKQKLKNMNQLMKRKKNKK